MQKQQTKGDLRRTCILWLGIVAIALLLTVPHILSAYTELRMTTVIGGYNDAAAELSPSKLEEMKEAAEEYNRDIYEQQKRRTFEYAGAAAAMADERYLSVLRPNEGLDTMCSLSVPKITLNLPVAHGTNSDELDYELGHMYGSSLPWGGENTHSVIAGHSGLKNADLFTYLERLETGDKFYISVLDEIHEYTVDQITTVLPAEEAPYLQVVDGQDLCTLYTCTPIGINDHRLLVRGVRTGTEIIDSDGGSSAVNTGIRKEAILKLLLWLIIPLILFIIGLIRVIRKRRKMAREKKAASRENAQTENGNNPEMPGIREDTVENANLPDVRKNADGDPPLPGAQEEIIASAPPEAKRMKNPQKDEMPGQPDPLGKDKASGRKFTDKEAGKVSAPSGEKDNGRPESGEEGL